MSRLSTAISELRENDKQSRAFEATGHCAVLAPPGSGKTKLLTTRVAYDLVSGAIPPPQGAACITMTNEAAGELRRRLRDFGVLPRPNVFVGTVHAFALSAIVAPYARAAERPEIAESRLASQREIEEAFERAFIAVLGAGADPRNVRSTMEKARRLADYSGEPALGGPEIADLARRYEAELQENGTYDFNDLMRHAVEMVAEHEWLRRILIATYPHLYVDEYQDLPPTLDALVRTLSFDQAVDATLFAVGDPDQAINGFLGTRPELLLELSELSGVTRVDLELNYRCGQDIIDASMQALGEKRNVRGVNDGGEIVIEASADGPEAQRKRAVELVQRAVDEGVPYEQITVLAQENNERDLIVDALRADGFPVFARSDRDYGTTPVTMAIEALALHAATEPPPAEHLADLLDTWQAVLRASIDHEMTSRIVELLTETPGDSPAGEFVEVLTELGLHDLVADPGASQDGRELERMREALKAPDGELVSLTVRELGDRARARGRVMAATTYGIKGLEFDVVIVCDCEEGKMPHWGSIKGSASAMQEDRRKFYVSLTRARRRVHILSSSWRISKRTGKRYPVQQSRFVRALSGGLHVPRR